MIPIVQARGVFTQKVVDVFRNRPVPTSFFRSFFPTVESTTKYVSIEVQRGTEKVAVDVLRGADGNRNTFSRSSQKIFLPPFFKEYLDATQLDMYDRMFASSAGEVDAASFAEWLNEVTDKLVILRNKIERAYELQCAQVLTSGIVTMKNGVDIDFKRKVGSMVVLPTKWDDGAAEILQDVEAGCDFIRTEGKTGAAMYDMVLGSLAFNTMLNNTKFKSLADIRNYSLIDVKTPQSKADGKFHGEVAAGGYRVRLWTYPEFYDDVNGVSQPYWDPKSIVILPESPRFRLAFGAVPVVLKDPSNAEYSFIGNQQGAYAIASYLDDKKKTHEFEISSAGVAIPVAVDTIYTAKVLA